MPISRKWRVAITALNAVCAVVSLAVGTAVLLELRERPTAPAPHPRPRPVTLPQDLPSEAGPFDVAAVWSLDHRPPAQRTFAYEDAQILADPVEDFARAYKVVFASVDGDPERRVCIVEPRSWGDQLVLIPGERLGPYLLLGIEPEQAGAPSAPRRVRLRFQELRRGAAIEVVLVADP